VNAFQQFTALCSRACDTVTGVRQPSRQKHRERDTHNLGSASARNLMKPSTPDILHTCHTGILAYKYNKNTYLESGEIGKLLDFTSAQFSESMGIINAYPRGQSEHLTHASICVWCVFSF